MRRFSFAFAIAAVAVGVLASTASAQFGLRDLSLSFTSQSDSPIVEAGSHPASVDTTINLNTFEEAGESGALEFVDGALKDLEVELPDGFAGNPAATPRCSTLEFAVGACPDSSAIGVVNATVGNGGTPEDFPNLIPVYNLEPPPRVVAKIGFVIGQEGFGVPVTVNIGLTPDPPYRVLAVSRNTSQAVEVYATKLTLWGNPADPIHDPLRGSCLDTEDPNDRCGANVALRPFVTMPRSCEGPLQTTFRATGWWEGDRFEPQPATPFAQTVESPGVSGCAKLAFGPRITVLPTTEDAGGPSGLNVSLDVDDEGFNNPVGIAHSDIKKAVVALPEGVTLNPSMAAGLQTCSMEQLAKETAFSEPGEGCPQASKVGAVEVESPALEDKVLRGSLFVATQDDPTTTTPGAENPFDALIAIHMVIKDPELGVIVKQSGKIEADEQTGRIKTIFEDLPQFPLSHVRLRLREGGRSPLITPSTCGTYTTRAEFTPWANPANKLVATSSFEIKRGVGGGPCPAAGAPPFLPGFTAGSINNNAATYTPFVMRFTRRDGDQDITRLSAVLPPGVVAKLAGTSRCSEAAIAVAKARRGRDELAAPSCPASSRLGTVIGGAGVGSQLTYVSGSLYLAGPIGAAPLSVVAIIPAVAGPFDVGTVVVRQALVVNPRTAEVRVDGSLSEPLPRLLAGIPLKVRDVRVIADRPQFTLNPTSCDPYAVGAQLWGSDNALANLSSPFQAANCSRLGFKPHLKLTLRGGTKRGAFPALTAVYRPRPGEANLSEMVMRLPRSAFLEQGHFRTICTRVRFAADACPRDAIYGHATAYTPLLDEPLTGPIYLRSSSRKLPDLVLDLHGLIDVEAVARVDSHKGGIRATLEDVPDAPISRVVVQMQGGKRGLIVNSRDLCRGKNRANVGMTGHNSKQVNIRPLVRATGCKKKNKKQATGKRKGAKQGKQKR